MQAIALCGNRLTVILWALLSIIFTQVQAQEREVKVEAEAAPIVVDTSVAQDEWDEFDDAWGSDSAKSRTDEPVESSTNDSDSSDLWADSVWDSHDIETLPYSFSGFVEVAAGNRVSDDNAVTTKSTLRDARLQVRGEYALTASKLSLRADLWYDGVKHKRETQVRELAWQGNLAWLGDWGNAFDLKIGQQVLTWGTGDYVFLNDLFPKDYQSFFSGRDDEYLKAPSASIKLSGYWQAVNLDIVVTPKFEPDVGITGEVFSFFSAQAGRNIAPAYTVSDDNTPEGSEIAVRAYRAFGSKEIALYGYRGYTKQPTATDMSGAPRYSRLNVLGASIVMPLGKGIANAEYAYYRSREDVDGTNPLVTNSQSRYLIGYSQELFTNITGSMQWYTEAIHHHDALLEHSFYPEYEQEKYRHWITSRLTWQAWRQTLTVNGFLFVSPSDHDGYLKANITYAPTDDWQVRGGVNLFRGDDEFTFFGQFEDASNVYFAFRYFY